MVHQGRGPARVRLTGGPLGAVLTLIVLVIVAITWEAARASRAERATAEAVLRDYAGFAAWEYARAAQRQLEVDLDGAVSRLTAQEHRLATDGAGRVHAPDASCSCPGADDNVRTFVHWNVSTDEWRSVGVPLSEAARSLLAAQFVSPGPGSRPRGVHLRVLEVDGGRSLVAWRHDGDGAARHVVHAVVTETDGLAAILRRAADANPLLPPTLVSRASTRDVLALHVIDAAGQELWGSPVTASEYAADATVDARFGGLRVIAALAPDAAANLIIGGLPFARLPWLYGLMALAAILAGVALVQMRRQGELVRLRSDFVSGVSHELRTPLAQIRMFAETLLLGRVRSADESRRSLAIIHRESQRLSQLVENVLCVSRAERGLVQLSLAPVPIRDVVRELVETVQPFVQARRASVVFDVPGGLTWVLDPSAVRQMLLNLVDNALKYGPEGQTITLTAARDGGFLRLSVEDEGPGVPEEIVARIWEPFWRAAGPAHGGSGIGLSIVRDLSAAHGGRAYLDSRRGTGARFVIELPDAA